MSKSAFRRRRAFSLIEVTLAAVAGSMLLSSMIYATIEMRKAVRGIYNEVQLQSVIRDLQGSLESNLPARLSEMTNTNGARLAMTLTNVNGKAANINLSGMQFAWQDDVDESSGGKLKMSTDGVNWTDMIGIGARGMFDVAMFGYGAYATAADLSPPDDAITYYIDPRVREKMVRVTARLAKDDMVPMYLQSVWAPRVREWDDLVAFTPSPGAGDTDGDGTPDTADAYPWDPSRSTNGIGAFLPVAVNEATISAATIGQSLNVFEGGGSGNFGWLTWNGNGNAPTLAGMIANPENYTYINPNLVSDHSLETEDWVSGNTGISNSSAVRSALDPLIGSECIVLVWDNFTGNGSNAQYQTAGFAKVVLTGYSLPGKSITATYLGLCDRDGNLLPGLANGGVPDALTATPAVVVAATPTPTPVPTPTPTATPTPSPTPTPTPTPVGATPSPTPTPVPTATATATPTPVPTPTATPVPSNDLWPVVIKDSIFAGRASGFSTGSLTTSDSNWRWAVWSGGTSRSEMGTRLAFPGNSETYVNPLNAADTRIDVGDRITTTTDADNHNDIRNPINDVVGNTRTVVVPLYSAITSSRATVSGFAKVRVTAYATNSTDNMTFTYLGTCKADGSAL